MATDGQVSYDAIENHDDLIAWSRRYCERAIRVHGSGSPSTRSSGPSPRAPGGVPRRSATPVIEDAATGRPYEWDDGPPTCTVALTWPAFEAVSRGEWRSTLRHDLVHLEQFQRTGTTGQGPGFSERAVVVDAVESCLSFAEPNYLLHCSDCEDVVASRFRASRLVEEPGAYRSGCCEAPLSVKSS